MELVELKKIAVCSLAKREKKKELTYSLNEFMGTRTLSFLENNQHEKEELHHDNAHIRILNYL